MRCIPQGSALSCSPDPTRGHAMRLTWGPIFLALGRRHQSLEEQQAPSSGSVLAVGCRARAGSPTWGLTHIFWGPQVKVWRLPESGQDVPSSAGLTLGPGGGPVDVLQFHPTADGVLASGAGKRVTVWDVGQQQPLAGRKFGDVGAIGHWAARAELAWRWWQHAGTTLVWVLNSVALSPEEPATAS